MAAAALAVDVVLLFFLLFVVHVSADGEDAVLHFQVDVLLVNAGQIGFQHIFVFFLMNVHVHGGQVGRIIEELPHHGVVEQRRHHRAQMGTAVRDHLIHKSSS